jgi:hypothetical protein
MDFIREQKQVSTGNQLSTDGAVFPASLLLILPMLEYWWVMMEA